MSVRKLVNLVRAKRRRFLGICLVTLICGVGFGSGIQYYFAGGQSTDNYFPFFHEQKGGKNVR